MVSPVLSGKQILVPKGAVLHGRIVELEQQYYPSVSVRVMLRFSSVDFNGASLPIALASLGPAGPGGRTPDHGKDAAEPDDPGEHVASIWVFGTSRLVLETHTVWQWLTQ